MPGYVLVEGRGEKASVLNLVNRLWADCGLAFVSWREPIRFPNLHLERGIEKGCELIRARGDAEALLLLRDDEDNCPREVAPARAQFIRTLGLPFPVAYVIMYREYETLFLASLPSLAGKEIVDDRGVRRPGIHASALFVGNPEGPRDAKGWLTQHMPKGRSYKPTVDQLPLTRHLDFGLLRSAALPCFGSLERGLHHLAANRGRSAVYPPASFPAEHGTADLQEAEQYGTAPK